MFELIDERPPVEVPESEYRRLLGYPRNREPGERVRELMAAARSWFGEQGRPWIFAREIGPVKLSGGKLGLAGTEYSSARLAGLFREAQAHAAVVVAVSAGCECEAQAQARWRDGQPDEYFFLEVFGSAVVEHLLAAASGRLCGWAEANGVAVLPHCSPGYAGWDIAGQIPLRQQLGQVAGEGLPGELEVLESGMLRPKKSQLAVFGLTREVEKARRFARLTPCEDCPLSPCRYRRAPHKPGRAKDELPPLVQR